MEWKAELVETLPDGAQKYRIVKPKPEPPKQRRRFVADYKTRFMELYGQGLNDREIGEELGFHQSSISGFRRKLGLPPNKKVDFPLGDLRQIEFLEDAHEPR